MTNELSEADRKAGNKAIEAARITEDPIVIEALARMEYDIHAAWKDPRLNAEQREDLHRLQATLDRFVGIFDLYLQGGAASRAFYEQEPLKKSFSQRIMEFFNHGN